MRAPNILTAHIPGARFLDIDQVADRSHPAPHMLPRPPVRRRDARARHRPRRPHHRLRQSARCAPPRAAGSCCAILARNGSRSSTAAWANGAPKAARSKAAIHGRATAASTPSLVPARWSPSPTSARGLASRWSMPAAAPGSRAASPTRVPASPPGHVPGSRNLPFAMLYNEDGTFKREGELREAFVAAGVDPERPFVASCGSGVTANSLIFAAHLLGNRDARLYDGSWSEWGADPGHAQGARPGLKRDRRGVASIDRPNRRDRSRSRSSIPRGSPRRVARPSRIGRAAIDSLRQQHFKPCRGGARGPLRYGRRSSGALRFARGRPRPPRSARRHRRNRSPGSASPSNCSTRRKRLADAGKPRDRLGIGSGVGCRRANRGGNGSCRAAWRGGLNN